MTKKEVKKLLKENKLTWKDFSKWMTGQTVGMINEEIDYYDHDVKRFIAMRKHNIPTYFD